MTTTKERTEQLTLTFPKNKKYLLKELRRMKEEDGINLSAYGLLALEEKIGFFTYNR